MNIPVRLRNYSDRWPVIAILLIGFLIRIRGLTYQSLWLDELHTMNEAGYNISFSELFHYLRCCDQHPPLYFLLEKISFSLFGHNAWAARFVSVLAGTAGIGAMYLLGKELYDKKAGWIAAILTAVNFYHISYSQEARPYILAFLFAALSFVWFIR